MCILHHSKVRKAALHEAAHIVTAYIAGYNCIESIVDRQGNGTTRINYRKDMALATALMNMDKWKELFSALPRQARECASSTAFGLCNILLAGGIAEAIDTHGLDFVGIAKVQISGTDLIHARELCKHFGIDAEESIKALYGVFKLKIVWQSITSLAEQLQSQGHLSTLEIENTLKNEAFIDWLESQT